MRRLMGLIAAAAIGLCAAGPAQAQESKPIQGYVAGGYVMPEGVANDYLNGGWNISGGTILRPAPHRPLAVRFDLGYSYMGANSNVIDKAASHGLRVDSGYMSMWDLTAEGLWEFGHPGHTGGWLGVGFGGYRRYLELSNTVVLPGYICDPWWGWCYPAAVPGQVIAANDTTTKFGYNVSVGINFPVGHSGGEVYVETRYHWMDTPTSTEYWPILIGYRF